MDTFCYLCFMFIFAMVSSLFTKAFDHLLGKGLPIGFLVCCVFLCLATFLYGVPSQVLYMTVLIPDICLLLYFELRY